MSRRSRNTGSNVRGPNSALTEFLRVEGITDAFRRRRQQQVEELIQGITTDDGSGEDADQDVSEINGSGDSTALTTPAETPNRRHSRRSSDRVGASNEPEDAREEEDEEEEEEIRQMRIASRRKRRNARNGGDDDFIGADDDDDNASSDGSNANDSDYQDGTLGNQYKQSGENDTCIECGKVFVLTVYSRFDKLLNGYLCESCNDERKKQERNSRKNQLNARKKRKKMAQALLDKSTVKIASLQDVCIKTITQNIGQVEQLGDIGAANLNKISKILCKNRSLNDFTMTLFLHPDLKRLEFWDCSNVDSDSFNKIGAYCPQVESLTLYMCGQLHNDNLQYFSSNLPELSELRLDGPFLISDSMWQEFFENFHKKLTKFEVRNTHRFGNDSLISLLENCGSQLTSLKLSRLDGIDSTSVYELIPHYIPSNTLTELEISYPNLEDLVTDALIINLLSISRGSLVSLNLDGCCDLTNDFITEGLIPNCSNLTRLSLKFLDQLTNDLDFTKLAEINGGLISLNLTKCVGLSNSSVYSLLKHSSNTLVELSLNSLPLTKNFLWQILTDDSDEAKRAFKEREIDLAPQNGRNNDSDEEEDEDYIENYEYFPALSFPLLTSLDLGFVRSVDNQILTLISQRCPKLKVLEVFGDNRCTNAAKTRDDLIVIGRQSDTI